MRTRDEILRDLYPDAESAGAAVLRYEQELERAADVLQKTHPLGPAVGIGLLRVGMATEDVCGELAALRSRVAALEAKLTRQTEPNQFRVMYRHQGIPEFWDFMVSMQSARKAIAYLKTNNPDHEVWIESRTVTEWTRVPEPTERREPSTDGREPCCDCGEDYPRADLINRGHVYCPKCRKD